jgi:hypothetical protein
METMNDFRVNLAGYTGIVKDHFFNVGKGASEKKRSFLCESGIGCDPTPGTRRAIKGNWVADGMPDSLSSYDFEYVVDPEGKRIDRAPEEVSDVQPVKLASECATAPKLVRRKKGKQ